MSCRYFNPPERYKVIRENTVYSAKAISSTTRNVDRLHKIVKKIVKNQSPKKKHSEHHSSLNLLNLLSSFFLSLRLHFVVCVT